MACARWSWAVVQLVALVALSVSGAGAYSSGSGSGSSFIKSSCAATTYPAVCEQSLMMYASGIKKSSSQLAQTALAVTLSKARGAKDFVGKCKKFKGLKARELEAIHDCFEEMSDTVDRLAKAVAELKGMKNPGSQDFQFHVSNIQTWVSAALTDENTCFDGYSSKALNGRLKSSVRAQVLHVAHVTSNALALLNSYAAKPN